MFGEISKPLVLSVLIHVVALGGLAVGSTAVVPAVRELIGDAEIARAAELVALAVGEHAQTA